MPTNVKKSKKKKYIYEISEGSHLKPRSHLKPNALSQLVGSH